MDATRILMDFTRIVDGFMLCFAEDFNGFYVPRSWRRAYHPSDTKDPENCHQLMAGSMFVGAKVMFLHVRVNLPMN
jgi:hypothetical protein